MIVAAANEVLRTYPDQMIAVEGHTDNDPVGGIQFHSNRELSLARAMSVYEVLIGRARIPDDQLTVVAHGSNRPVVSNGSPEGKRPQPPRGTGGLSRPQAGEVNNLTLRRDISRSLSSNPPAPAPRKPVHREKADRRQAFDFGFSTNSPTIRG